LIGLSDGVHGVFFVPALVLRLCINKCTDYRYILRLLLLRSKQISEAAYLHTIVQSLCSIRAETEVKCRAENSQSDFDFELLPKHHEARLRRKGHSDEPHDGEGQWYLTDARTRSRRFHPGKTNQASPNRSSLTSTSSFFSSTTKPASDENAILTNHRMGEGSGN